jgi:hypothetical protein
MVRPTVVLVDRDGTRTRDLPSDEEQPLSAPVTDAW